MSALCARRIIPAKAPRDTRLDANVRSRPHLLEPQVLTGKPVVRGTRLSVEFVVGLLADGWSEADILGNYPALEIADIRACLAYARDRLASEKVYPTAA